MEDRKMKTNRKDRQKSENMIKLIFGLTIIIVSLAFIGSYLKDTSLIQYENIKISDNNNNKITNFEIVNNDNSQDIIIKEYSKDKTQPETNNIKAEFKGVQSQEANIRFGYLYHPNIKTEVIGADINIKESTITLEKKSNVNAIYKCDDFDVDKFSCNSGWKKTDIQFIDNGNSITFTVDSFSAYAGGIIEIRKADHLDSNKEFIADVYDIVSVKDGNSVLVSNGEYLRVTFEQELDSSKDITIYGNGSGVVEVYTFDGEDILMSFEISEYKEYKKYLNKLVGEEDTFDLKVIGDIWFDYVVDPFEDNGSSVQYVGECGTLSTQNTVYYVNQTISTASGSCLIIKNDSITLDCQGNRINGGSDGAGIFVDGDSSNHLTDVIIRNCSILDFDYGVYMEYTDYSSLYHINASSADNDGLYLTSSSDNSLSNMTSYSNGRYGIYLYYSNNNVLKDGHIYNHGGTSDIGIYLRFSNYNNISNCISNNNYYGFQFQNEARYNRLFDNNISFNSLAGIHFYGDSNQDNNYIYNNYLNNYRNFRMIDGSDNFFNTSLTAATSIVGGANSGGNFWTSPENKGYSDICNDSDSNGICDSPYTMTFGEVDALPLADTDSDPSNADLTDCSTISSSGYFYLTDDINAHSATCMQIYHNDVVFDCQGHTIDGTDAGSSYGFLLWGFYDNDQAKNVTIKNCIINDYSVGIYYYYAGSSKIINNTISSCSTGLYFWNIANYNVLENNSIIENQDGLTFYYSGSSNFSDNIISDNTRYGVFMDEPGSNNIFHTNEFVNNGVYGVYIQDNAALNNLFYNNLFNNSANVYLSSQGNYWNTSAYAGTNIIGGDTIAGNAWYIPDGIGMSSVCNDTDGDDICDSSFDLVFSDSDHIPLYGGQTKNRNISSCTHIEAPGYFYLDKDLTQGSTCMKITSLNTHLDCKSYKITGSGSGDGVAITGLSDNDGTLENVTLDNCIVERFNRNIFTDYVDTSLFRNNTAKYAASAYNVYLFHSDESTLIDTKALHSQWGMYLYFSGSNNINDTYIFNMSEKGFMVSSGNSNVINNITIDRCPMGIDINSYADYNEISSGEITESNNKAINIGLGSNDNTFHGLNISNNNIGVYFSHSGAINNLFYNNYFENDDNVVFGVLTNNYWNTTNTTGQNIAGGQYTGGNYWSLPGALGFSNNCSDGNNDGYCDNIAYDVAVGTGCTVGVDCSGNDVDYLPLYKEKILPIFAYIDFTDPTPSSGHSQYDSYVEVNVSVEGSGLSDIIFAWNGQNYSYYEDNLVLMYNFDNVSALGENSTFAKDLSGMGNDGYAVGGASTTSDGKYDGGFYFDGNSDYITCGTDLPGLSGASVSGTLGAWFKADQMKSQSVMVIGKHQDRAAFGLMLYPNGTIAAAFNGGYSWISYDAGLYSVGDWHYFVASISNGGPKLYMDGKPIAGRGSTPSSIYLDNCFIGKYTGAYYFNGTIDGVRIWNRTLSADEVYQQYASNLKKYDTDKWLLYINQSENATTGLAPGDYTYQAFVNNAQDRWNSTEQRDITITAPVGDSTSIGFVDPTPNHGHSQTQRWVEINASIEEGDLESLIYSWDLTNYTIYNDSLALMFNFDNVSVIGENSTHMVDVSSQGNLGIVDGAVFQSSGRHGGAYLFDDDHIAITDTDNQVTGTGQLTVSAWIKPSRIVSWGRIVAKPWTSNTDPWSTFALSFDDAAQQVTFTVTTNSMDTASGDSQTLIQTGQWTYVTGVYDGSYVRIYVNGIEENSASVSGSINTNSQEIWIGENELSAGQDFEGLIDEVRLWNRALSSEEIAQSYMTNLKKYSAENWELYVNQTQGPSTLLPGDTYYYQAFISDSQGNSNTTEARDIEIIDYPPTIEFNPPTPDDGSSQTEGWVAINSTIQEDDLTEVSYSWNDTNYTIYGSSLVLMYNFDNIAGLGEGVDTVVDMSLDGNDGQVSGNDDEISSGRFNTALDLTAGEYLTLDSHITGPAQTDRMTVAVWLNVDSVSGTHGIIEDYDWSTGKGSFAIRQSSDDIQFYLISGTTVELYTANNLLSAGQWTYLVCTYDGSYMRVYADGTEIGTGRSVSSYNILEATLDTPVIGKSGDNQATHYYAGKIDEIRVWDRALSSEEINLSYMSNLRKYDTDKWELYVNQTENPDLILSNGTYGYRACAEDISNNQNCTGSRTIYIGESPVIEYPTYDEFKEYAGTTLFNETSNLNSVQNPSLKNRHARVKFLATINVQGLNFDRNMEFGRGFVYVNTTGLGSSFNTQSEVSIEVEGCADRKIYYSSGNHQSKEEIISDGQICNSTTTPACTDITCVNNQLNFTAPSFSGYAVGDNTNLTIYDEFDGSDYVCSSLVTFYANYTNSTGHIAGAECNITFSWDATEITMTDNGNNYEASHSLPAGAGGYEFTVNCSATGYDNLEATDPIACTLEGGGETVPEFGTIGLIMIIITAILGVYVIKQKRLK